MVSLSICGWETVSVTAAEGCREWADHSAGSPACSGTCRRGSPR